jgi:hypothetical protein
MSRAGATDTDIARNSEWSDPDKYAYVNSLPAFGCAWEFLRRNPDYQRAWRASSSEPHRSVGESAGAAAFGLVRFESPERDARSANVFWHRTVSREVLPVIASRAEHLEQAEKIPLTQLQCRVTIQTCLDSEQQRRQIDGTVGSVPPFVGLAIAEATRSKGDGPLMWLTT